MQITLTTEDGGVFPLEVSADLTLGDLKALLEGESGLGARDMLLVHNMAPMMENHKTLGEFDVQNDDIIMISQHPGGNVSVSHSAPPPQSQHRPPPIAMATQRPPTQSAAGGTSSSLPAFDWGSIQIPGVGGASTTRPHPQQQQPPPAATRDPNDPETIRQHFLSNPYELSVLQERNPHLADAILDENPQRLRDVLEQHTRAVREQERERIQMMNADPLDPEYQSRIAHTIQQRNIQDNMEAALEYMPESFSRVVMLYLPIKVNGVPVKALVDSGARSTIMSERCAERCNIMRLVDRRFAGIAFGVGRQRIIGKVHLGQLQIGNDFLTSSFQVLQDQSEDMLLGLDMLRRHQCCIDLKNNVLKIGTTGNDAAFLTEADLKEKEEMERKQAQLSMEDEDAEMAKAIAKSESESKGGAPSTSSQQHPVSQPEECCEKPPPPPVLTQQFPEASISRITSAGFSREEAVRELGRCEGNADLALTALLARSIKF